VDPLTPAQNLDQAIAAKCLEINGAWESRPDANGAAGNSVAFQAYFDNLNTQLLALLNNRCHPQIAGIGIAKSRGIS
jgi:hypothetical protein